MSDAPEGFRKNPLGCCGVCGGPWDEWHGQDDECPKSKPVTQAVLESWGRDIFRRMDERMDVVARQLNLRESETHTVALMAAMLYGKTSSNCVPIAKNLYRKIQLSLEKDRTIVGQIPKEKQ